ncbi:hypothetical protein AAVH_42572, partial [Aphelenchoides avenae]
VLKKFPVVQHFVFGSLFSIEQRADAPDSSKSMLPPAVLAGPGARDCCSRKPDAPHRPAASVKPMEPLSESP